MHAAGRACPRRVDSCVVLSMPVCTRKAQRKALQDIEPETSLRVFRLHCQYYRNACNCKVWRRNRRTQKKPEQKGKRAKGQIFTSGCRWSPNPLLVTPMADLSPGADESGCFQPGMNDLCKNGVLYTYCTNGTLSQIRTRIEARDFLESNYHITKVL